ncbi:hypothetical protein O181_034374 [Austropuccinia psidii MF-1]|uniref:Uncharacterized protein n=1 Tax=Austropuccinia psidii MF-1 TaxID=1389203 RepID=A0A9Q3D0Q3_9BASI|nr:hypothetical protein [Austropuccinia psidii MF-1]
MSLKAQTHLNTICNVWVLTPHGATQQFSMLIFVHEKTSAPPPGHLTPLPCLLSHLNWLLHPGLILSKAKHACAPTPPFRLPSLRSCSALKMRLQCLPHHSLRFPTPSHLLLGLQFLHSCGALKLCL